MKLLVTRPLDDAGPLAQKLQSLGHEAVIVPLLAIKPRENVLLPDGPFQAVCTTSANGLVCKADLSHLLALPFHAIGSQSAAAARQAGFTHVSDKGGNVEGLAQYICRHAKPGAGPILYLSGAETSGDLEGKLKARGFSVVRAVVYDAVPETIADLAERISWADGVLLYSPRTAKIWQVEVAIAEANLSAEKLMHFCLSANVAAQLPKHWPRSVSESADENGMLSMLDRAGEAE